MVLSEHSHPYLKNQLQVLHVGLLGLDELVDVTLSLPLLGAHGVQRHEVGTPCSVRAHMQTSEQAGTCMHARNTPMTQACVTNTFMTIARTVSEKALQTHRAC